jgi:hypothetical protein
MLFWIGRRFGASDRWMRLTKRVCSCDSARAVKQRSSVGAPCVAKGCRFRRKSKSGEANSPSNFASSEWAPTEASVERSDERSYFLTSEHLLLLSGWATSSGGMRRRTL